MTPAERDHAIAYLAETRESLLRATRGLLRGQLSFKPIPDRWSAAECLEHIVVVERRVLERVAEALRQPVDPAKRSAYEGRDDALVAQVTNRSERAKAPEMVIPTGRWPHERLLPEFELARKSSAEFAATNNDDLRRHLAGHPRFGELDCYQWLLLIGSHGERHRQQIEEAVALAENPRTAGAV